MRNQTIDAFESAIEYMEIVNKELLLMIEDYSNNEPLESNEKIPELFEGLNWIYEVVKLTKDYNSLDNSELVHIFSELKKAFENNEYKLLSDVLKYELMPLIKDWREALIVSHRNLISN